MLLISIPFLSSVVCVSNSKKLKMGICLTQLFGFFSFGFFYCSRLFFHVIPPFLSFMSLLLHSPGGCHFLLRLLVGFLFSSFLHTSCPANPKFLCAFSIFCLPLPPQLYSWNCTALPLPILWNLWKISKKEKVDLPMVQRKNSFTMLTISVGWSVKTVILVWGKCTLSSPKLLR